MGEDFLDRRYNLIFTAF